MFQPTLPARGSDVDAYAGTAIASEIYADVFIDAQREQADWIRVLNYIMNILNQVYDELIDVQEYDDYLSTRCLWHDDERPSLLIYKNWYRCKSCGKFGKTIELLQKLRGGQLSIPEPVFYTFNNPFSRWLKNDSLDYVVFAANKLLKNNTGQKFYLTRRGISDKFILNLEIGYRDGWYIIPIKNQKNHLVGAVARVSPQNAGKTRYVIPHGQSPDILYSPNWSHVVDSNVIYIVFGIFDAISMCIAGFPVITPTAGKTFNYKLLQELRKKFIIIPDKFEEQDAQILAGKLGWRGSVKLLHYYENEKDPNDVFVNRKDELLRELYERDIK